MVELAGVAPGVLPPATLVHPCTSSNPLRVLYKTINDENKKGHIIRYDLFYFIGGAGGSRTRVRKYSAFRSTCLAKSFSLIAHHPTGRESARRFQLGFSELALNIPQRDLVRVDPGDLSAQAHVRPRTLRQVIKLLVRSCHRWQL